jgi:hypothetical protein
MTGTDEEPRIQNIHVPLFDVVGRHRIHVMNDNSVKDLMPFDAEIATFVSSDDTKPKLTPLIRRIELLIHPSIESEGCISDCAMQSEVFETLLERGDLTQL